MKSIKFIKTANLTERFYPVPASSLVPEWYKKTHSYLGENQKKIPNIDNTNGTTATIKKCMPVFDAMTTGYFILLPADVYVHQKDGLPYYQWSDLGLVDFHPIEQAPNHPDRKGSAPYPKFISYWGIKTPKGYSCLFTAPKHRNNPFTILDGIVDTDTYFSPVNFPFVLNDITFEGMIPAGTPIAQVIPFKRDAFEMEIGDEDLSLINSLLASKFFDRYKNYFWAKKDYK
jgi:hypothetical protein